MASAVFIAAYNQSSNEVKENLQMSLDLKDFFGLKIQITNLIQQHLDLCSVSVLRTKAKSLLIDNWWLLRKDQLIDEIQRANSGSTQRN